MRIAYLSIGSNLGNRKEYLLGTVKRLERCSELTVECTSSLYETEPVGYVDQPNFLNLVIEIKTNLDALALLDLCQSIENDFERKREVRWGPRTVDLDILLYNNDNINAQRLTVPHPRMTERMFVLIPLLECNPAIIHPVTKRPLQEYVVNATGEVWKYKEEE